VYDPSPAVVAELPTAVKALDVIVPGWTVIPERAAPPESATLPLIVVVTTASAGRHEQADQQDNRREGRADARGLGAMSR